MKLRILLYLILMNVLLWSCQKDYYLDELNAEKEKNEELLNEIHGVRGTLDELREQNQRTINELLVELDRREPEESSFDGWYSVKTFIPEFAVNDAGELPEICSANIGGQYNVIDDVYVEFFHGKVVASYLPQNNEGLNYLRSYPRFYGTIKTWEDDNGDLFIRTADPEVSDCGDGDGLQYFLALINRWKVEKTDPPTHLPYTIDAIQDAYTEMGVGFYGDPIYSQIKSDDIDSYIDAFYLDAERHGVVIETPRDSITWDWTLQAGVAGQAHSVCDLGSHHITINQATFDDLFFPSSAPWLSIIWHELGHEVFQYFHPYPYYGSTGNVAGHPYIGYGEEFVSDGVWRRRNDTPDIMGYESWSTDLGKWNGENGDWEVKIDRFFTNEGVGLPHDTFVDFGPRNRNYCEGSKGGVVIDEDGWDIPENKTPSVFNLINLQ